MWHDSKRKCVLKCCLKASLPRRRMTTLVFGGINQNRWWLKIHLLLGFDIFPRLIKLGAKTDGALFYDKNSIFMSTAHIAHKKEHRVYCSEWNKKNSGICIALLQLLQFQQRFWCKGKISKRDIVVIKSHVIFPGHGSQKCHTFFCFVSQRQTRPCAQRIAVHHQDKKTWRHDDFPIFSASG